MAADGADNGDSGVADQATSNASSPASALSPTTAADAKMSHASPPMTETYVAATTVIGTPDSSGVDEDARTSPTIMAPTTPSPYHIAAATLRGTFGEGPIGTRPRDLTLSLCDCLCQ